MSTEDEVKNAVKEFWIKEDEYILLNSKELIAALPEHLLPPINYLPHFELTENQWIYRARPANASYLRGDARNLISNYTFPQKKYTQQGRVNHPNQPMFYGSEFISATAFESRWNMEDDSLIGCWKINKKSPNAKFAMCLSRFREEIKVDLDSKLSKALLLQLKFLDEIFSIDRDKNFLVEEHDGKEIKKETPKDKIHKISASIAQHIIERENVDGIIYLSAQGQGAKALFPPYDESDYLFNVALLPSYVKEHMNLKVVYKVSISTHFDGTNRKRAERKATHIGIPLNNNKLAFSKITKKQNNHFNSIHNNSGVPVINTKYTLGIPEIYITNKPLFNDIINNNPCSQHKLTADLWNEETEGIKYQVVQPCCDESSEHLKEILRSHDIWKD